MAFEKICTLDDVWEGEMESFEVRDGREVLMICLEEGKMKAFQAICPHQKIPLVEGELTDGKLICRAHLWEFDCADGKGLNPTDCAIAEYPVKVDGEDVLVDVAGIEPLITAG